MSTPQKNATNLDLLRILSALLILCVHICQYCGAAFEQGLIGLRIFFIMSGYLIGHSLDHAVSLRQYYKKRIARIIPAYYTALVLIFFGDLYHFSRNMTLSEVLRGPCGPKFLRFFAFLQELIPSDDYYLWNNRLGLWTMSLFFVFYLTAPLIYRICSNFYTSLICLGASIYVTPIWKEWIYFRLVNHFPEAGRIDNFSISNPLSHIYCFLFGVCLFRAVEKKKTIHYLLVLFLTAVCTSFNWNREEICAIFLISVCLFVPESLHSPKTKQIISFLSKGSFFLYLTHQNLIRVLQTMMPALFRTQPLTRGVLLGIISIFFAYGIYALAVLPLEKKLSHWAA